MIVNRLLKQAIRKTGALDLLAEPEPTEYENALESANSMLKTWAVNGLVTFHIVKENFALEAGKADYTIGTDGDFNTARPNQVVVGFLRDSNGYDYPVKVIDREKYNSLPVKTLSARPTEIYVYPTFPLSTIYTNTEPDQAYTLYLDSLKPLTALALDTELNLPPEYEEAIIYNLAMRLCPDYGRQVPVIVAKVADDSLKALSIQPVPESNMEGVPGTQPHRYNIYTGE